MNQVYTELNVKQLTGNKGLVIYFFPKAKSGPCTIEANEFNNHLDEIKALGFNVVGISVDEVKDEQEFINQQGLKFPIVADTNAMIGKSFGIYGPMTYKGTTFSCDLRTTFIVDKDGKNLAELKDVNPVTSANDVINKIKQLSK